MNERKRKRKNTYYQYQQRPIGYHQLSGERQAEVLSRKTPFVQKKLFSKLANSMKSKDKSKDSNPTATISFFYQNFYPIGSFLFCVINK